MESSINKPANVKYDGCAPKPPKIDNEAYSLALGCGASQPDSDSAPYSGSQIALCVVFFCIKRQASLEGMRNDQIS